MTTRRKPTTNWEKATKRMAKYLGTLVDDARAKGDDEIAAFLAPFSRKIGSCGMLNDSKKLQTCSEAHMCYRCAAIDGYKCAVETNKRMIRVLSANPLVKPFKVTLCLRSAIDSDLAPIIIELIDLAVAFLRFETMGAAWTLHVNYEGKRFFPHIHALVLVESPSKNWSRRFCRMWAEFSGAGSRRQYANPLRMEFTQTKVGGKTQVIFGAYRYLKYLAHGPRDREKRPLHPERLYTIWLAHCEASNARGLKRMHRTRGRTGCLYGASTRG